MCVCGAWCECFVVQPNKRVRVANECMQEREKERGECAVISGQSFSMGKFVLLWMLHGLLRFDPDPLHARLVVQHALLGHTPIETLFI